MGSPRRGWIRAFRASLFLSGWLLVMPSMAEEDATAPASAATPAATATTEAPAAATVPVTLHTRLGDIVLRIETVRAPVTAANFLRYVDQKRFDNSVFYRAMKIGDTGEYGIVQGGLRGNPKRALKPIAHEPTSVTGLHHVSGAVSMARAEPGTASSDFFIVLGDLTALDAHDADPATGQAADPGYAVFGHVSEGMDVVRAILGEPISATAGGEMMKGQMLETPVPIVTMRRTAPAAPPAP
jgi:peptidyl-prolyl cis-trans isomerase A (cyclophilin A)